MKFTEIIARLIIAFVVIGVTAGEVLVFLDNIKKEGIVFAIMVPILTLICLILILLGILWALKNL
jgi:hypothetical protein